MANPLDKRVIEFDPLSLIGTQFFHDDETGVSGVRSIQDTRPIVEANKISRNEPRYRKHGEEFRRVASIPLTVLEMLRKQGILRDRKAMKKWLNDPDNRAFRTTDETV